MDVEVDDGMDEEKWGGVGCEVLASGCNGGVDGPRRQVKGGEGPAAAARGCGSSGRWRGGKCRRQRRGTPLRDTRPPEARTLQHTK